MSKHSHNSRNPEQTDKSSAAKLPSASPYAVRIAPDQILPREEFESRRADRDQRGDLVSNLAHEVVTSGFLWKLRRLNPERSVELLRADCLIAIDRLIRTFNPERGTALDRYVASYLRNRVIDLWREEGRSASVCVHPAPEEIPAQSTTHHEKTEALLASLSPLQKKIASARMQGALYRDIAHDLGISESALYAELRALREKDEHRAGNENKRTDFERFVAHLLRPDTNPQKLLLSDYARSPEFFARYLHEMRDIFRFKRIVRSSYDSGHDILGVAAPHLARHIEQQYGAIDCIPPAQLGPIARLLHVPKNVPAILQDLHRRGACSLSPPDNHRWHERACDRRLSPYFDRAVVGASRAAANIHHHIAVVAPTLAAFEDPRLVRHVARLLDMPPQADTLQRYCIQKRLISPLLPSAVLAERPAASPFEAAAPYFDRDVVGESAALSNVRVAVQRTFPSLDAINRDRALMRILGCNETLAELVQRLAAPDFLGATPPIGTTLIRPDGHLTRYADERFVGPHARAAFDQLFRAAYKTVDDLPWTQPALARALGSENSLAAIARAAMKRGLLPDVLPEGHPWYRPTGSPSRYFSPAIVGAECAIRSLKSALEPLIPRLDAILDLEESARLLHVPPTERAVARRCITLGITDGCAKADTPILRPNGDLSLHLDPRVRRRTLALDDLRMIVAAQQLSIEELCRMPQLAILLRCEPSRSGILSGLERNGVTPYHGTAPDALEFNRSLHPAFDRAATPPLRWHGNMKKYLMNQYSSLDEIRRDRLLAEALRCPNTAHDIARTVVAERLMEWRAPIGFSLFGVPGGSFYVDEDVMGDSRRVNLNIRRSLRGNITTLDEVYQNEALASALQCERNTTAIAAALVERRVLTSELPAGHPFTIGHVRSRYFDPVVVGHTQMNRNIETFLRREAPTLDDLPMIDALCNTLQIERRRHALAEYVVHFGIIDWRIPSGHDVARAGGSLYLNREVLGRTKVESNVQAHLIDRYGANLDALPKRSKSLASALDVENSKAAIIRAILERGILPPRPPQGYDPSSTTRSVYLNPAIVGSFTAASNRGFDVPNPSDERRG